MLAGVCSAPCLPGTAGICRQHCIHTGWKGSFPSSGFQWVFSLNCETLCSNMVYKVSGLEEPLRYSRSGDVLPSTLITEAKNIWCVGFRGTIHGVKSNIIIFRGCFRSAVGYVGPRLNMSHITKQRNPNCWLFRLNFQHNDS